MGDETNPGSYSDYTDQQYTQPTKSVDTGWFGDSYANEADPSWEDVIAMVVIPGSPARIKQAADEWSVLLQRLSEVERVLTAVKADLESWKGAGGEQYRSHLTMMITNIRTLREDNASLPHHLHLAAGDLEKAIAKIPIPDDMIAEVMAAKQGYIDSGMISDTWGPNAIYQYLLPVYGNKWFDEAREFFTWDWAANKLRDWISSQDDKAKDAYHELAGSHVKTMALIPGPNPVEFGQARDPGYTPDDFGGPGGGGGGMPGGGKMPGGGTLPGGNGLADMAGPPSSNMTDPSLTNPGYGDGYDPDDLPGSGLAGAGGGLVGAGPGAGGLGGGLGAGAGAGGLGAGGLGAGGVGRGAGGGIGGGMGMMPGMGAAGAGRSAGRGVTGANAGKGGVRGAGTGAGARGGAGGFRGGMMPGAAGGHGAGEGEDHSTWLQEDDDPWGSDSEAPPSVLG
ncbi:hypothetical protein AB0H83_46435 [Dactylosporangium sp. NPDC050688]|uniref:hypothetical protein n=1 Tax=Dactylosporangium sp. NPDC050688 TaxID=3157217 RepID=UPI003411C949